MGTDALIRAGGAAAILAGVLRAAVSFASGAGSEIERQSFYFIIDLLLLIGVFAVYAQHHETLGRMGAAGFLTTVAGILVVRSSRAVPGLDVYPAGALLVAVGWTLLSFAWCKTADGYAVVPLLLVLSVVIALFGQFVPHAAGLLTASGVLFGAAMVGAGWQVLAPTHGVRG